MESIRRLARFVALPLAVAMCWVALGAAPAQAGLVGAEKVVTEEVVAADRAQVKAYLARQDVQGQLQGLGIDAEEAAARVDSLTDTEVQQIASKLDQRPAGGWHGHAGGGHGMGSVVGAAVFVFIVLLITDIAGFTDVFPFVNK